MKASYNLAARKRPVNLTLNEDLVARTRCVTENLSGVVESLLAEFLAREQERRAAQARETAAVVAMWNEFGEKNVSFADEHSTI